MIDVDDLSFSYPGAEAAALKSLSFEVSRGEVFGFLGPSGAGKTTAQKVLIGLLDGYEGTARVFEREVAAWGADLYERVGVSFEAPTHFGKLTARENLEFFGGLFARPALPADQLLALVDLGEAADRRVDAFSKGMKNRLSVARALVHEPDLLFLDEPTAGLDPVNARRVRDIVRTQRGAGRTVILTTHDMVTADELCDRVAFIVDGELRAVGAPERLRREHGRRVVRIEHRDRGERLSEEFPLDGLAQDDRFQQILRAGSVETIHTLEASLEQVFVEITGRQLA
jgi:fluoroquinolone transport system ATP-binding protein